MLKIYTPLILLILLFILPMDSRGQYFQFSQSAFSEQRINPTYVARSDFASASFLYRQQTAAEDFNIKSSFASLSLPFIRRDGGSRWSGVGLTFLDDRSGQNGIFRVQELGLSYAIRVPVAYNQSVYFGVRGMYESRAFSLDGLYTGTQYIPGRGFNSSIASGETPDDFRQQFFTFSTGLSWEATDRKGVPLAHAGIAVFDINKVDRAFFNGESVAPVTAVLEGGIHLTGPTRLSLDPVALITFGQRTDINLGAIWGYGLTSGSLDLVTRYVIGRYAIAGIQYEKDNFAIGFSYDLPLNRQSGNRGSIEFGIKLKRLIKSKPRKTKVKDDNPEELPPDPIIHYVPSAISPLHDGHLFRPILPETSIRKVVFFKESDKGDARAGDLIYYPYVNENSTLTFHFDFNSTQLSERSREYLTDIANLLKDNPTLRIKITGHTDNAGPAEYNEDLSLSRAIRIREFLVNLEVEDFRIGVFGKGESEPVASNDTEEGRAANRRVEFNIIR